MQRSCTYTAYEIVLYLRPRLGHGPLRLVEYLAMPRDSTTEFAGLFYILSLSCVAPSREAVETIVLILLIRLDKGNKPQVSAPITAAPTWWCRLRWVEMAGCWPSQGSSYPGHFSHPNHFFTMLPSKRPYRIALYRSLVSSSFLPLFNRILTLRFQISGNVHPN